MEPIVVVTAETVRRVRETETTPCLEDTQRLDLTFWAQVASPGMAVNLLARRIDQSQRLARDRCSQLSRREWRRRSAEGYWRTASGSRSALPRRQSKYFSQNAMASPKTLVKTPPPTIITVKTSPQKDRCEGEDFSYAELPPVAPFCIGWDYPLFQIRTDLDPAKMRKTGAGRHKIIKPLNY
jgi:hypothetical protein